MSPRAAPVTDTLSPPRLRPPARALAAMLLAPLTAVTAWVVHEVRFATHLTALLVHVLGLAVRPGSWTRAVRIVLWRQIYFTGAQALPLCGIVAMTVGIAVVLQAKLWLTEVGQSELLGPILVSVIVRELAPVLVCVIVILRSGSAIATELGSMAVHGEFRLLRGLGLDPLRYLLMPRIVAFVISVLCLDIVFTVTAFATGYFASLLTAIQATEPLTFALDVLESLRPADLVSPLAKCVLGPLVIAGTCCAAGLLEGAARTEIPKAATRALSAATTGLFVLCVLVSAASYLL